ncbi:hypothetical protein Ancab_017925 [Ancistrocladus abbreviatus]
MGRKPCCAKEGLNRGAWSAGEDKILADYIQSHGEGKWRDLPQRAGLLRCGKSCRLRWLNYLKPDIKRGNITEEEEELIIKLHKLLGNRWSLIAGRLPGRTDNEIKNYWNTTLSKRTQHGQQQTSSKSPATSKHHELRSNKGYSTRENCTQNSEQGSKFTRQEVIHTKAVRCTRHVVLPWELESPMTGESNYKESPASLSTAAAEGDESSHFLMDFDICDLLMADAAIKPHPDHSLEAYCHEKDDDGDGPGMSHCSALTGEWGASLLDDAEEHWTLHDLWKDDTTLQQQASDLKELASFLDLDIL